MNGPLDADLDPGLVESMLEILYSEETLDLRRQQVGLAFGGAALPRDDRRVGACKERCKLSFHVGRAFAARREAKLRQARDWFQQNYKADSFNEAMRIAPFGTEHGNYVGMVIGYWEQACALLNYGLLHEELFFETSGEFFYVWENLKPAAAEFREAFKDKNMLSNLERAAQRYEKWCEQRSPGHIEVMRQYMDQERAKAKSANA